MALFQHMLFAADLSDAGEEVAHMAKQVADQFAARLSLVHVVESIPEHSIGYIMSPDIEQKLVKESGARLANLARALHVKDADQHLLVGSPKNKIVELAEKIAIDLIMVGSHDHHGLALLLGTTTGSLVHTAPCHVMVLKSSPLEAPAKV